MSRITEIRPLELTLTLGLSAQGAPLTDDGLRREARVSATYRLGPGEINLTLVTAAKAVEVGEALDVAWWRAGQTPTEPDQSDGRGNPAPSDQPGDDEDDECPEPFGKGPRDEDAPEDDFREEDGPFPGDEWRDDEGGEEEGENPSAPAPTSPPPVGGGPVQYRVPPPARPPSHTPMNPTPRPSGIETTEPTITMPLKLAIKSLARQVGLEGYKLTDVLRSQFGTWSLDRLTKTEAHDLHIALQRSLQEHQELQDGHEQEGTSRSSATNGHVTSRLGGKGRHARRPPVSRSDAPSPHH